MSKTEINDEQHADGAHDILGSDKQPLVGESVPNVSKALQSGEKKSLSVCKIIKNFLSLAIPTIISCLCQQLTSIINAIYAGRMNDPAKLAGVGLGTSWLNVICFSILVGTNGAQETLAS